MPVSDKGFGHDLDSILHENTIVGNNSKFTLLDLAWSMAAPFDPALLSS